MSFDSVGQPPATHAVPGTPALQLPSMMFASPVPELPVDNQHHNYGFKGSKSIKREWIACICPFKKHVISV